MIRLTKRGESRVLHSGAVCPPHEHVGKIIGIAFAYYLTFSIHMVMNWKWLSGKQNVLMLTESYIVIGIKCKLVSCPSFLTKDLFHIGFTNLMKDYQQELSMLSNWLSLWTSFLAIVHFHCLLFYDGMKWWHTYLYYFAFIKYLKCICVNQRFMEIKIIAACISFL